MVKDNDSTVTDKEEKPDSIFDQIDGVDWLLAHFIAFVEMGLEIGVTLTVGGQVVSGTLIGGRTYFTELGAIIAGARFSGSLGEGFPQSIGDMLSQFKEIYPPSKDLGDIASIKPNYIHLRDALYFQDRQPLASAGVLWRAKLSSVDGFSIGSMSPA